MTPFFIALLALVALHFVPVRLSKSRFWPGWRRWLRILKPDIVLRWHRRAFTHYWTWKSRRRPGRPGLAAAIRDLIEQMGQANFLWGAPRIHGELLKLGIQVAPSTVDKYLRQRRILKEI